MTARRFTSAAGFTATGAALFMLCAVTIYCNRNCAGGVELYISKIDSKERRRRSFLYRHHSRSVTIVMDDVFWVSFFFINVYAVIPTVVIRVFGFGVRKETSGAGIALTFDDGPDPEYTPKLLDLLGKYNIKATFFVLGAKAEKHPEIIIRMHHEGHLVGVHNYVHRTNALMTPWKVRGQLAHSIRTIENIIGVTPLYYRPPWGVFNVFDILLFRRVRVVLWSLIVGDWVSKGGAPKIKKRLLAKLKNGDVIVLHDSGQTFGADKDAPVYMLQALQDFLEETSRQGYEFLRVDHKIA